MMSEYYDHYHRWEPLAEFHFFFDEEEESYDENYIYCLCSRAFIRDGVRTYYAEKEYGSESDAEVVVDSHSQDVDDHSHVHFSLDTSYKVKCEKDEGASCYCSASHTDNYCSTDELDPTQIHGFTSHALQPSDSGADLTYQDTHSDYTTLDKIEKMEQDFHGDVETNEDYLSEDTWEKFWAFNGERIIWASWIKKYSDYINPAYLGENSLASDDNNLPKQNSAEPVYDGDVNPKQNRDESMRERKYSYDSKVNPYKKELKGQNIDEKYEKRNDKDETWLPVHRRRSCSEHERIVSPRTLPGTDSMTNVTKMTLSSYNITSSHVTSNSTPTDDYSVSSSTSDDQFNDQTRIINMDDNTQQLPSEELDTEQYWQFLWKKHFGEQYALHYANFIECHQVKNKRISPMPETKMEELKCLDVECENSEGNSQELPSVIEVQTKIDNIQLEEKVKKPKRKTKNANNRIISSVGVLLQNLLKEQREKDCDEEIVEGGDGDGNNGNKKTDTETVNVENADINGESNIHNKEINVSNSKYNYEDGDDEPPEDKPISLKRSHEIDDDEIVAEKINSTFQIMGFALDPSKIPKGQLIYRKRLARLRPPRYKRSFVSKKTYFDDSGNPYQLDQSQGSQEDEMLTDDDGPEIQSDVEPVIDNAGECEEYKANEEETEKTEEELKEVELVGEDVENSEVVCEDDMVECTNESTNQTKRKRRGKRHSRIETCDISDMPEELKGDPKMYKYWKKRHSLFHRFDEGVRLDRESWFSVTPERVARHVAARYRYDTVVDAFCGAGGNTLQFALTCKKVIAIDIDPVKIEMARHNAAVYGVAERVHFIVGDFLQLAPTLAADMVFLSPPWGGPAYSQNSEYDIETMLEPKPASELVRVARQISSNITLYLPRNTKTDQILALAKEVGGSVEIEQSYLDRRFVAITAYYY